MVVPVLIVPDSPLLDAFGCHWKGNVDPSVLRLLCGKDSQLHGI